MIYITKSYGSNVRLFIRNDLAGANQFLKEKSIWGGRDKVEEMHDIQYSGYEFESMKQVGEIIASEEFQFWLVVPTY